MEFLDISQEHLMVKKKNTHNNTQQAWQPVSSLQVFRSNFVCMSHFFMCATPHPLYVVIPALSGEEYKS
jgi:hypothetical protein